ncbi:MAG TPA: HAD hydrolase-like protein [Candidatus Saccharimonadales bacterium]|nr:HAD hydrolase-like protein [Candidatus Saccharimonadales bacterium]
MSEAPRHINAAIHDFDGTLADSGAVNLEAMAQVLGRDAFTAEEVEDIRRLTTLQGMQMLGIRKWQLPRLLLRGQRIVAQNMHRVDVFEGIPEAIGELDAEGYSQYVLSTNSAENIRTLLDRHDLTASMRDIHGGAGMFGKARRLTNLIKREGLLAEHCVYVGDEGRDVEAARKAGVQCVAVAWGFQDAKTLAAHEPDALVTSPAELADAIRSLQAAAA